jgi:probable phosphoglycerate mutase
VARAVNRLYLVRHGENPANLSHEFSHRRIDYPLTEKGRLQARQTAEHLASIPFDLLATSPLLRAVETTDLIGERQRCPITVVEEFREMNVGSLEGMVPQSEAWSQYAEMMRRWFGGHPEVPFPSGESRPELVGRFRRGLEQLAAGRSDASLLVVGHGGIFTHGVAELCGIADQKTFFGLENHNCSVSRVDMVREADGWRFVLVDWASVDHLSGEAAQVVQSVPDSARIKNL